MLLRRIDRSAVPLEKCVNNIVLTAQRHKVIIQTLFSDVHGDGGPSDGEVNAYIAQLEKILDANGQIDYVQVHTVRRIPAEKGVIALPRQRLDDIANSITTQTGLKTVVYI